MGELFSGGCSETKKFHPTERWLIYTGCAFSWVCDQFLVIIFNTNSVVKAYTVCPLLKVTLATLGTFFVISDEALTDERALVALSLFNIR